MNINERNDCKFKLQKIINFANDSEKPEPNMKDVAMAIRLLNEQIQSLMEAQEI